MTQDVIDNRYRLYRVVECHLCGWGPGGESGMVARRRLVDQYDPGQCARGKHALVGDNIYLEKGRVKCVKCRDERRARRFLAGVADTLVFSP